MIPMRQRVLLVAGWVIAAALTSLVASGAVAVAGGQVNDRPLTKVLAADVAALPVVDTEGIRCTESPLPPAASNCTTETPSAGAQDGPGSGFGQDPAGGDEGIADDDVLDPLRPDGLTPTIDPGDIGDTADDIADAGPNVSGPPPTKVVTIKGGSVSFAVADGDIWIPWIIPQFGYTFRVDFADQTTLRVTFTLDDEQNGAVARLVDDELTVETFEGVR